VVMEYVDPGGAAASEGFEPGDTITQIGNRPINGLGDVAKAFHDVQPGDQVAITVNRGSAVYSASFPMPSHPPGGP
jgi:S1-C subfamily serine protease